MRPELLAERNMQRASERAAAAYQSYTSSLTALVRRTAQYHDKALESWGLGRSSQIPVALPQAAVKARADVARKRKYFEQRVAELKDATREYHRLLQKDARPGPLPPERKRRRVILKQTYRGRRNQNKLHVVRAAQHNILGGMDTKEAMARCKSQIGNLNQEGVS